MIRTSAISDRPARAPASGSQRIPPFQSFLEEHRTLVYRFLAATVGSDEADDVFQETFLAALRAYPKLKHAGNLKGWILAIASRKAIDAARARSRRPRPVPELPEIADVPGGSPDPLMQGPVWGAVRALPPRQRVALVHRVVLDQPYAELAAAMGISADAARADVYQALRKLREGWNDDEEER
jgi:RNA polymerase sigma factor (sigma-70 family)